MTTKRVQVSPYWQEISDDHLVEPPLEAPTHLASTGEEDDALLQVTFSELAAYDACGVSYRLRNVLGFQPTLAPELGYGKTVHHVMRTIAERTKADGVVPDTAALEEILDEELFLPAANKVAHREMKQAASRLVAQYVRDHSEDLHRVWMTERPFELHLGDAVVSGRADVILDQEDRVITGLAIVDYKTSTSGDGSHDLQLQVYANAGRREGLDVRAAYVHDLKAGERTSVNVSPTSVRDSESYVRETLLSLRQRVYEPAPGSGCRSCDVRVLCRAAPTR